MNRNRMLTLLVLCTGWCGTAKAQPWVQHGPLEVPDDSHYIQHEDGTAFFWMGATPWALFLKVDQNGVNTYLNDRETKGFTVIQASAFFWPHISGAAGGPHNEQNAYGDRPFTGGFDTPNTSGPKEDGGYDFWDNADYVVDAVKDRDMYLALWPCWGRAYINENGPPKNGSNQEFNASEAKTYGRFLGERYGNEPHIIWVMGGDTEPTKNGDKRNIYREMAEGVAEGVWKAQTGNDIRLHHNTAHAAWDKVLMTYQPSRGATSATWFHNEVWLDFNGNETDAVDLYPDVYADYQRTSPVKPIVDLEALYEHDAGGRLSGTITLRRQAYHCYFAGGAGYTYGCHEHPTNGDGPLWGMHTGWQNLLDEEGATQMRRVKELMTSHPWWKWVPTQGIILSGAGSGETRCTAVCASDDSEILVYYPQSNRNERIDNIMAGDANATWYNTRIDATKNDGVILEGQNRWMRSPTDSGWEDAILVLEKRVGSTLEEAQTLDTATANSFSGPLGRQSR